MKNKKITMLAVLVALLLVVGVYTYARYTSTFVASGDADVAAWSVKLTDGAVETTSLTYTASDSDYVTDGKIAPGSTATATVYLDASGSEVALDYTVTIDTTSITNDNIEVTGVTAGGTALSGSAGEYTGSIALDDVGTAVELVITVTWTDENTETANAADTTTGTDVDTIEIPVTITATQKVA